jgi:hypothetical protein
MNMPPPVVATIIQPLWRKKANLADLKDIPAICVIGEIRGQTCRAEEGPQPATCSTKPTALLQMTRQSNSARALALA